ncbi:extracellular solute-binding protein [Kribbella italica]|uniref:Multiple sugar transport system substrate-binding protein n=1 Tax=Kribbella italica TaxID=1540520 RepID=A0A7W9JA96_9ACTN|nr:extracellular solute-binding protein [Kribbella italica]MBB5838265.1 multiple sugar transport system substrate-binding protein [Kribbella italica]
MLTRRRFLGTAAALAGISGCSSVLPEPDVAAPGFGTGATGTVKVWCRAATQTGLTSLVEKFNASQDRLRVELTPVLDAQYVTKLATAIRGRGVPDLVDIDDINSMLFIYRDAFTDLTEALQALDFRAKLSPGHLRLATRSGRAYGVPYLADNSMFWFNTELCDRADVDPDQAVTSYDELLAAARRLRKLGDDIYAWSFPANSPGALGFVVQPMVWAADTDLIRGEVGQQEGNIVGNDVVQRMLELHRQLWVDGLVPRANFSDDASRWGSDFRAGAVGIFPSNYSVVVSGSDEAFHAKVTPRLLSGPDGGSAFFDGGDNMCIPRGAENASGAWEFVRFALDLPQQSDLPAGGYTPVRSDVATPEFAKKFPLATLPLERIEEGYAPTTLSYNLLYNQPDGPWLQMFRRAVFDGELEAAMSEAQESYDRILAQGQA